MATTSIGADRGQGDGAGVALERYNDAAFMRDDKKFYLGTGGDFSVEYDEDGNDVALAAGADLRFSDTQQLQFGDSGDFALYYDGTTSDLVFLVGFPNKALSDVNPGVSDALFLTSDTNATTSYLLSISSG